MKVTVGNRYQPGDLVRLASDPRGQHGEVIRWDEREQAYRIDWLTPFETGLPYMTASIGYVEERDLIPATIDPWVFEQDPGKPEGTLRFVRTRTLGEVYDGLVSLVDDLGEGHNEYLSLMPGLDRDEPWPVGQMLISPVNGSSEGDYTRIAVVTESGDYRLLILAKTFDGRDASWRFARLCADIFEA